MIQQSMTTRPVRHHRSLAVLATLVLALCQHATPAAACSCVRLTREQVIERTPVVFVGEIVGITTQKDAKGHTIQLTTFRVTQRIKGQVDATVVVRTHDIPGMCGWTFRAERKVYTVGGGPIPDGPNKGAFTTGMCTMVPLNPRPQP